MISREAFKARWQQSSLEIVGSGLIIVAICGLAVGYFLLEGSVQSAVFSASGGVLGGGVFTWLTKLTQLGGVIRDELEKIVYAKEHLSVRVDSRELWMNATRSLYGNRFPGLMDKLTEEALSSVWPSKQRFYLTIPGNPR